MNYSLKEAQEMAKTTRKAIRYYEQQGLLQLTRFDNHIIFTKQDIVQLQCIIFYRELGMQIQDIRKLIQQTTMQECILDIFDRTYDTLQISMEAKQKQLDIVERVLAQKKGMQALTVADYALLTSKDMVTVEMMPIRLGSVYIATDITISRKEYRIMNAVIHVTLVFVALALLLVIVSEFREYVI